MTILLWASEGKDFTPMRPSLPKSVIVLGEGTSLSFVFASPAAVTDTLAVRPARSSAAYQVKVNAQLFSIRVQIILESVRRVQTKMIEQVATPQPSSKWVRIGKRRIEQAWQWASWQWEMFQTSFDPSKHCSRLNVSHRCRPSRADFDTRPRSGRR